MTRPAHTAAMRRSAPILGALLALIGMLSGAAAQTPKAQPQQPAAAPAPAPGPAPSTPDVTGVWLDDTGDGAIEIARCGPSLCGRIVWLKAPLDKAGQPLTDGYNPDRSKRVRPICGLSVIGGLKAQRGGAWDEGWIYDPKEGKTYDVALRLAAPDQLQVTGYLGVKWLSETFTWTRVPQPLPGCRA